MKYLFITILFLILIGPIFVPWAIAEDLTIVFEDMRNIQCLDTWEMGGLTFRLLHYGDGCRSAQGSFGWGVYSACLEIDVRPLLGLQSFSVIFTNYGDPGSVFVSLMDIALPLRKAYCVTSRQLEELVVPAHDLEVERVMIYSYSALFHSVSFEYDAVPVSNSQWGSIKAMFR